MKIEFFKNIYKKSYQLTIKNKWLLIPGLIISIFSFSTSFNISNITSSNSNNNIYNFSDFKESLPILSSWISNIPIESIILLVLVIFIIIVIHTLISLLLTSWAKGAIIGSLNTITQENSIDLRGISKFGFDNLFKILIYEIFNSIYIFILFVLGIIFISGFYLFGYTLFKNITILYYLWIGLSAIWAIVLTCLILILSGLSGIYVQRLIVLKKINIFSAYKKSFQLIINHIFDSLLVSFLNSFFSCLFNCLLISIILPIGLLLLLLSIIILLFKLNIFIFFLPYIASIFIILLSLNLILNALIVVFKYSTWNELFNKIYEK